MMWPLSFLLVALIAFVNAEVSQEETLKASLDHFSSGLYKHSVAKNEGKNMVISPLSAQIALALLSMGADGKTLEQLQSALMLPDKNFTKAAFKKVMSQYNDNIGVDSVQQKDEWDRPIYNPKPPTLRVVNKLFVKDSPGYDLDPDYKEVAVDSFRSEVENVNFAKPIQTANIINSWVEEKTNKKIKDLVQADKIDQDTRMMLINAVYFKAAWRIPFKADWTHKTTFHVSADETVEVDFIRKMANFEYVNLPELDARAIKLGFYGSGYSMLLLVPNKVDGLKSVEDKMASADLSDILKRTHTRGIDLTIPKFKIETDIDLKEILPKMGISKIFNKSAEFGGILQSREDLYVSEAQQKAFIEIDEYGCEAAAATRLTIMGRTSPMPIKVNVPFYYAIVDGNGNRMFSGRIINPKL